MQEVAQQGDSGETREGSPFEPEQLPSGRRGQQQSWAQQQQEGEDGEDGDVELTEDEAEAVPQVGGWAWDRGAVATLLLHRLAAMSGQPSASYTPTPAEMPARPAAPCLQAPGPDPSVLPLSPCTHSTCSPTLASKWTWRRDRRGKWTCSPPPTGAKCRQVGPAACFEAGLRCLRSALNLVLGVPTNGCLHSLKQRGMLNASVP